MNRIPADSSLKRQRMDVEVDWIERMWRVQVNGVEHEIILKKTINDRPENRRFEYGKVDAVMLLEDLVKEGRLSHLQPGAELANLSRYRGKPFTTNTSRWFSGTSKFWSAFLYASTMIAESDSQKPIEQIPLKRINSQVIFPNNIFYEVSGRVNSNKPVLVANVYDLLRGFFHNAAGKSPLKDYAMVDLFNNHVVGIDGFYNWDEFEFSSEKWDNENFAHGEVWLRNPEEALERVFFRIFTASEVFFRGREYTEWLYEQAEQKNLRTMQYPESRTIKGWVNQVFIPWSVPLVGKTQTITDREDVQRVKRVAPERNSQFKIKYTSFPRTMRPILSTHPDENVGSSFEEFSKI